MRVVFNVWIVIWIVILSMVVYAAQARTIVLDKVVNLGNKKLAGE